MPRLELIFNGYCEKSGMNVSELNLFFSTQDTYPYLPTDGECDVPYQMFNQMVFSRNQT